MKKVIVVMLALFLAIPAITYAGSATSRYDVTIGGYVKFDMGWSNQNQGPDYVGAVRGSLANNQNKLDEFGNLYFYSGETRLNLRVKGPDAWGAKTGAFIEGDFRGGSISQAAGVFELRQAFMTFDWAQDQLLIGQTWNDWGYMFQNIGGLGFNELADVADQQRYPQIRWTHKWNKNWSNFVGIYSEYNATSGTATASAQNDSARSLMPHFMGQLKWQTDSCGKIGPFLTELAFGGFYGQEKYTFGREAGVTKWETETNNVWMMALKGFIPIIPEKKGNKAGAFAISGFLFYGQLPGGAVLYTLQNAAPYQTGTTASGVYNVFVPKTYGGWGGLTYYFTDAIYINGVYSTRSNNFSQYPANNTPAGNNTVSTNQMYLVNLMWDVNPAVRLGLEYSRYVTGYGGFAADATNGAVAAGNLDSGGKADNIRIGAYYFF
jgi:hypothetical protein